MLILFVEDKQSYKHSIMQIAHSSLIMLVGEFGYSQHEKIQSWMTSIKQTVADIPLVLLLFKN